MDYIPKSLFNFHLLFLFQTIPDKWINWQQLSKDTTWELVKLFPNKPWSPICLSNNKKISIEEIRSSLKDNKDFKSSTIKWRQDLIIKRLSIQEITNNLDLSWNFESLSSYIPWEIVKKYPELNWSWCVLSFCNSSITEEIKRNNPIFPWFYHTPEEESEYSEYSNEESDSSYSSSFTVEEN